MDNFDLLVNYLKQFNLNEKSPIRMIATSLFEDLTKAESKDWEQSIPEFINHIKQRIKNPGRDFYEIYSANLIWHSYHDVIQKTPKSLIGFKRDILGLIEFHPNRQHLIEDEGNAIFQECLFNLAKGYYDATFVLEHEVLSVKEDEKTYVEEQEKINALIPQNHKEKMQLKRISIAYFCRLINLSGVDPQLEDPDEEYAIKICTKYKLFDIIRSNCFVDRVVMPIYPRLRQDYGSIKQSDPGPKLRKKYIKNIKDFIYPKLPNDVKLKIDSYIAEEKLD